MSAPAGAAPSFRKTLTVNPGQVTGAPLANFPLLFSTTNPDFRTTANGGRVTNANGWDIVFATAASCADSTSCGGAKLDHEIESYNAATGQLIAWVRVPSIDNGTVIYVHYGDSAVAATTENRPGVWDASYRGVWHLRETPAGVAGEFKDSTSNANNGTGEVGPASFPTQTAGRIDGSLAFDGTLERDVDVPHNASLQLPTNMTVSAWARTTSTDGQARLIVAKWNSSGSAANYWLGKLDASTVNMGVDGGPTVAAALGLVNDGAWHHVVGVADAGANLLRIYVDGTQRNTAAYTGTSQTGTSELRIGRSPDALLQDWDGGIDEVRVSAIARSAGWIRTEYANQSSPSTFYSLCDCASPLSVAEGTGTITVTDASNFEMTFDANVAGGAVASFYDLAEDPGRANDLAGSLETSNGPRGLHSFGMTVGGISYNSSNNIAGARVDLLEATPTRVRVRQEAFYQQGAAGAILAGVKGIGDYSVYPVGRSALRWERRTTSAVTYTAEYSELVAHLLSSAPLSGWAAFRELGTIPPNGTGSDAFLMAQNELTGGRTDLLQILHRDWTIANGYPGTADLTGATFDPPPGSQRLNLYWDELTGAALAARTSHVWSSLTYFKPTTFANNTDLAVTTRSTDYRTAAAPTVNGGKGSQWQDAAEDTGTGGDFFNESEAAYVFNIDPSLGLDFNLDGSTRTRYSPFLKIRQWRSAVPPRTITVDGIARTRDVHFKADVKPVSFAVFADQILWHSTLESAAALTTTPDIGSGGTMGAGVTFPAARYGAGAQVPSNNDWITFPTATGFDKARGAVEFWFQPTWPSNDSARHDMGGSYVNATNQFLLQKLADNTLHFTIVTSAGTSDLVIPATSYGWRVADWVHIIMQWDDTLSLANQQVLYVNGIRPAHTDPVVDYNSALLTVDTDFYIGNISGIGSASYADGIYDDVYSYSLSAQDASAGMLAHGGLTSDPREFLASPTNNATLSLSLVNGTRQGEYLFIASDSRFRGLNVVLSTAGAGTANLQWQFWNGTAWADLEAVTGFTDSTNNLKRNGNIYWTSDPPGWSPSSIAGGPDLYYVRAYVASGSYTTSPVEYEITTDILLLEYCGDVTTNSNFVIAPAVPTAVRLLSFSAVPGGGSVTLEWRTGSELDNLGFHLYRGPSAEGPWTRLNPSLIPGLGSSPLGQAYSWLDSGLTNGVRYYYRLEDLDASSKSTFHGPVSAVPAPFVPEPTPPGEGGGGVGGGDGSEREGPSISSCPPWVLAAAPDVVSPTCARHGDPDSTSLQILARDSTSVTLELRTGGFWALHEVAGEGQGTVRVFVPGLELPSESRAAALPLRRALVDAVVGKGVRLVSAEAPDLRRFPDLRPSAVGQAEMTVGRNGTVRPGRRALSAPRVSRGYLPAQVARLVGTVFQGERKSAVVEISPVRFDGKQLVLATRVRVKLAFAGVAAGEVGTGSRGRALPRRQAVPQVLAQLYTSARGLYAVRYEEVFPDRPRGLSTLFLRLQRQGEAVAFHVEPSGGVFGPGSVLYFYADREATSTEYTSEVAYELVRGSGVGMGRVTGSPLGAPVVSSSTGFASFETNRIYMPDLLEAPDVWLWQAAISTAAPPLPLSFSLSGVAREPVEPAARLVVYLQGGSESGHAVDHHVRVWVNGALAGEATFAGKLPYRLEVALPASLPEEGANELRLENVADTGVVSRVFLDRFEVSYPQAPVVRGGAFEGVWAEGGTAEVGGLSGPPVVLDLSPRGASARTGGDESSAVFRMAASGAVPYGLPRYDDTVRWLTAFEATGSSVRFAAEAGHRYLVVSPEGILSPRIAPAVPSTLRETTNQADYLVIAPREFLEAATPLLERRRSQGLASRAVSLEEIASEFGHAQESAEAIRSFLAYAYQSWQRPSPRYVLLLGESTYDPRHFLSTSWASPLPARWVKTSYLWTVSDPALAAVNGEDVLPDLSIGRLPATTVEEAERLISKVLSWEESGQGLGGNAVLVADDPDAGGDFEADVEDLRASFLSARPVTTLKVRELGAGTRPAILDAFDEGASLVSYVGHGGAAVWASENVLNTWDVPSLRTQSRQPLLLTMNCLNGYFVAPNFDSLSEALVKAQGRGAIAALSPSGLSLDGPAHEYERALVAELVSGRHQRLGDAVLAAQRDYAQSGLMPELLTVYQTLGDPAMRVR